MINKLIFTAFLLISSQASFAEWVKVASTLNDDAVFYVYSDSIKISDEHFRTAWELVNHPNGTRQGYKSVKAHHEYDCKSNMVRALYISAHSELFGKGKTVKVAEGLPLPWQVMPEGSVATHTRDYICSK